MAFKRVTVSKLAAPPHDIDAGHLPRVGWLPINALVMDDSYQRPLDRHSFKAIERIAAAFSWSKFAVVVVSATPDGRYAIIDGQHRTHAALLAGLKEVPCLIVDAGPQAQAAAFAAINGNVVAMTPFTILRAALAAGEPWAVGMRDCAQAAGCRLMLANAATANKKGGEIYAVTLLRDMIAAHGAPMVSELLAAYRGFYQDLPLAWSAPYLRAWIVGAAQCRADTSAAYGDPKVRIERLTHVLHTFDIIDVVEALHVEERDRRKQGLPGRSVPMVAAAHVRGAIVDALHLNEKAAA